MANLTWVKPANNQDPAAVILWEKSALHPGGEVYILGKSGAVQVALTPAVTQRLKRGLLVQVDNPGKGAAAVEVSPPSQTAAAVAKTPVDGRTKRAAGSRVSGL